MVLVWRVGARPWPRLARHPTGSAQHWLVCDVSVSRVPSCALTAQAPEKGTLRVATWNIAAINNNPFEYWITHDDADYNALMEGVQSFIDQPGAPPPRTSLVSY